MDGSASAGWWLLLQQRMQQQIRQAQLQMQRQLRAAREAGRAQGVAEGVDQGLEQAAERREDEMACVVCMDAPRTHLFAPCNHVCVCEACSEKVMAQDPKLHGAKLCPICRQPAKATAKVMLS